MPEDVCLCVFATRKYQMFLEGLIGTARHYFLTNHRVSFAVFCDTLPSPWLCDIRIHVPHLEWPKGTLYRYQWLVEADVLKKFAYVFMCDVDMGFRLPIGDEVLGNLVAVLHSGHIKKARCDLPMVSRTDSLAYRRQGALRAYYAGGFQGGTSAAYLEACNAMAKAIKDDESRGIVADWHDESHWNAYLCDHRPDKVLPPIYCWGEPNGVTDDVRIVAFDKEHEEVRTWQ